MRRLQDQVEIRRRREPSCRAAPRSWHPSARRSPGRRSGCRAAAARDRRPGTIRSRRASGSQTSRRSRMARRRVRAGQRMRLASSPCGPSPMASMRKVTSWTGSSSATKPYMRRCDRRRSPAPAASSVAAVTGPSGSVTRQLVVLAGVAHVHAARRPAAAPAQFLHARTTLAPGRRWSTKAVFHRPAAMPDRAAAAGWRRNRRADRSAAGPWRRECRGCAAPARA